MFFTAFSISLTAAAEKRCNWQSDCGEGYQCNSTTKECKMGRWSDGGCNWDSDCLDTHKCDDNECIRK